MPVCNQLDSDDLGKPEVPAARAAMDLALADRHLEPRRHAQANKIGAAGAAIQLLRSCHFGPHFRSGLADFPFAPEEA